MSLFCKHKWIEKERHVVTRHYTFNGETLRNCLLIIQECEKCGKLKKVSIP